MGCFESLRNGTNDETQVGMSCHSYDNIELKLGRLQNSLCNLDACMDSIETQCRQFAA